MCRRIKYHRLIVAYLTLNVKWVLSHNFWASHLYNIMKSQKGFILKYISQVPCRTTLNYFLFSVLTTLQTLWGNSFLLPRANRKLDPAQVSMLIVDVGFRLKCFQKTLVVMLNFYSLHNSHSHQLMKPSLF